MAEFGSLMPTMEDRSQGGTPVRPGVLDLLFKRIMSGMVDSAALPGMVAQGKTATKPAVPGQWSDEDEARKQINDSALVDKAAQFGSLAMGGAMPGAQPGALGIFGGRLAKTADQGALKKAEEMAAGGADRAAIWGETGWFQGADKKWRFEIPDNNSQISTAAQRDLREPGNVTSGSFKDMVLHPELVESYPDLARSLVQLERHPTTAGGFYDANPVLRGSPAYIEARSPSLGGEKGLHGVALHEGQHLVQDVEKFGRGGSPKEFFAQDSAQLARDALSWKRELDGMPKGMDVSARENAIVNKYREAGIMDWLPSREARDLAVNVRMNPDSAASLEQIVSLYGLDKRTTPYRPDEMYRKISGEVEARNVQKRLYMSPEERRARPPWETQDIPFEEQIVRRNDDAPFGSLWVP